MSAPKNYFHLLFCNCYYFDLVPFLHELLILVLFHFRFISCAVKVPVLQIKSLPQSDFKR